MTQQNLPPHGNIAPPAEQFTSLADTVHGTAEEVVLRSRRTTRRRIAALIAAVGVVAAVLAAVLVMRPDKPAATGAMTQDLAVAFVQSEFPLKFKDPAKLVVLFEATCGVLDAGGRRVDALLPLIQAGLNQQESTYIYEMSVRSTCPQYQAG